MRDRITALAGLNEDLIDFFPISCRLIPLFFRFRKNIQQAVALFLRAIREVGQTSGRAENWHAESRPTFFHGQRALVIGGLTDQHAGTGQGGDGDRPDDLPAQIINIGSRDLRDPGLIIKAIAESTDHNRKSVAIITFRTIGITGYAQRFQNSIRGCTGQIDGRCNFRNGRPILAIENMEDFQASE